MSQLKNRYKAKIDGRTYTIIGSETKTHMDIVTELANKQLLEIRTIAPDTSIENASILLAINAISDQLKKEKQLMAMEADVAKMKTQLAALTQTDETVTAKGDQVEVEMATSDVEKIDGTQSAEDVAAVPDSEKSQDQEVSQTEQQVSDNKVPSK